jgi:hypothetical protein
MTGDTITVMTTKGPLATKSISRQPDGKWIVMPYGNPKIFNISERAVGGICQLAVALTEIERDPRSLIVRGAPMEGIDRESAYRRLHARKNNDGSVEPATLRPASRHWVPLDLDSLACPDWLDAIDDPDRTVEYVVEHLPKEFHGVTCWWQFTSSQQFKPGIRMRLFFWSDVALADWQLKQWLSPYPADKAIFAAAQPIYVARPIFVDIQDPVPVRSGIWRGDRDAITPPTISKIDIVIKKRSTEQRHNGHIHGGYEAFRRSIGDHDRGDGFHQPIKSAVASHIAAHGSSVDTRWLRNDLEQAIRCAPRDLDKHPDHYIETRIRDLDTLIPRILEMQRLSESARLDIQECEPTYPAPMGSIAEARKRLAEIANQHVAAAVAYAAKRDAYRARLRAWEARQAAVA